MRAAICLLVTLLGSTAVPAAERAALRLGDDLFRSGDEVRVEGTVPGDALLAGGEVALLGEVGGDAALAGGEVRMQGIVAEDLYAAGGEVDVSGQVRGSARIAGGQVDIDENASIGGGVSIGAGEVDIDGHIGSYVQVAGGEVRIGGRIDGDVLVTGGELRIGPAAVIQGDVTYRGRRDAIIAPGAQILGQVRNLPVGREDREVWSRVFGFAGFLWALGWLVVGALLLALLPRGTRTLTDTVRARPGPSALLGLALLIGVPVVIGILAVTLIGIPLALLTLAAYLVLLPLGYLTAVAAISDAALPRVLSGRTLTTGLRILAFLVVYVLVLLALSIPFLGGLLGLLLVLFGIGGLVLALRRAGAPPPATA